MILIIFRKIFINNMYLIIGIILGVFLNILSTNYECNKSTEIINEPYMSSQFNYSTIKTVLKTNASRKSTKKPTQLIRPRYFSTELEIREKLFLGVFTSEEKIEQLATHVNKTAGLLVDKIKFFITAHHKAKNKLNYMNLVGFTDTRYRYRPFQVFKYVADNFLQNYDYYFFMNDYDYLNARKLKDLVEKISVSMNVYLGNRDKDSSYCRLDSGFLISNSVLQTMKDHLEWCIMNAVTDDHSENIGRCIYYSNKLDCQEEVQGIRLPTFKLKHFVLEKNLKELNKNEDFKNAVTVYPIVQKNDFYLIHTYFSKLKLKSLKLRINNISKYFDEEWPPGERRGSEPATRYDLPTQNYFNMTHMLSPDDFTLIQKHKEADLLDINNILSYIKSKVAINYPNKYEYRRLINGYRIFDLSRGMDYKVDLGFRDLHTGKEVIKRFEVCKPLGNVEILPVPFVTENTRVTILLPVQETQVGQARDFMLAYSNNVMEHHEKTFLLFIFLYQYNTSSKGDDDVFKDLKTAAINLSNKYHNEDMKVAWLSIRLPNNNYFISLEEYPVLNFALIDLALKKTGIESLILVLNVYCEISNNFLNRVRMNTVSNFQIFSSIPFRFYDPDIALYENLEISKNNGHFDREEYRFLSFYGRDYVYARKKYKSVIPLMRSDNDIINIINEGSKKIGNVYEMFVKHSRDLNCLRAPDKSLKIKFYEEFDKSREFWFMGTQAQLANVVLDANTNFKGP